MADRKPAQFDRKLDEILRAAAEVFCARGYHQASIRDISRSTRVSLAGLYYYFHSKEQLLYLIQHHAFGTLLSSARAALEGVDDPEERLRTFVGLHLRFFLDHPNEMKVLTHEEQSLRDEFRRELKAIKKAYYRLCFEQVEALKSARNLRGLDTRLAVLSLFGMMNWIYTWYNPRFDLDSSAVAEHMSATFLSGIFGDWTRRADKTGVAPARHSGNGSRRSLMKSEGIDGTGKSSRRNSLRPTQVH